jgi:hypothetical protein
VEGKGNQIIILRENKMKLTILVLEGRGRISIFHSDDRA